jgi:hypothetical protein
VQNWGAIYAEVKSGYMPPQNPPTIGPDGKQEMPWDSGKVATFYLWGTQANKFAYGGSAPMAKAAAARVSAKEVTWTKDIKKMFTSVDIAHMKGKDGFNPPIKISLDKYDDVMQNWGAIYAEVKSGYMPPQNPPTIGPDGKPEKRWSKDKVNTFYLWGTQKNKFAHG